MIDLDLIFRLVSVIFSVFMIASVTFIAIAYQFLPEASYQYLSFLIRVANAPIAWIRRRFKR